MIQQEFSSQNYSPHCEFGLSGQVTEILNCERPRNASHLANLHPPEATSFAFREGFFPHPIGSAILSRCLKECKQSPPILGQFHPLIPPDRKRFPMEPKILALFARLYRKTPPNTQ